MKLFQLVRLGDGFSADFDGETATLSVDQVYPEDEGEYTCVAYNDLGKVFTSACLIVDCKEYFFGMGQNNLTCYHSQYRKKKKIF
jgi:hypothetical protein